MAFENRNGEYGGPPPDKPGKSGVSYPTPNPDDYVVVESLPLEKGQYQKLPYGKAHPVYSAAKLISQRRSTGDDNKTLVTRVYAPARVNQDAYNAAITYTAKSGAHRILARSSLILREGYAPADAYTSDSQTPAAVLVDESAQPAEEPYNTLYLRVTRIFEDFGTRAEQDAWNLQEGTTYPYGSDLYPRLVRRYRFPANAVPTLTIGSTTDTQFPAAKLLSKLPSNESARVVIILATFEAVPTVAQLAALGGGGPDGLGIGEAFPEGDNAFPLITWKRRVAVADYVPAANNEACPLPGYTALVLTDQGRAPAQDSATVAIETREYQNLPGKLITSDDDAARLPRALTPIPAYYLNGDRIVTTKQKVAYGTAPDAVTNTILSSKVEATTSLLAVKTNITRASVALPLVTLPLMVDRVDGADGKEYRTVISIDPQPTVEATRAGLDAVVAAAVALVKDTFAVIDYGTTPLSPTSVELRYTAVTNFPITHGAEYDAGIPERFAANFKKVTMQEWIDTTNAVGGGSDDIEDYLKAWLLTAGPGGNIVLSCKILPVSQYRARRTTVMLFSDAFGFPFTLTSYQEIDGQLAKITETLSNASQTITLTAFMLAGSGITDLGDGLTLKTEKTLTSYPVLKSQSFNDRDGTTERVDSQIVDKATGEAALGSAGVDVIARDALRSEKRTKSLVILDSAGAPTTDLSKFEPRGLACTIEGMRLPDVLLGLKAFIDTATGPGDSNDEGKTLEAGTSIKLDLNQSNSNQGSAAISLNVIPDILTFTAEGRSAMDWFFYSEANTPTADILTFLGTNAKIGGAAIGTVLPWPIWQPKPEIFMATSQKVSGRVGANARLSLSAGGGGVAVATGHGNNISRDVSLAHHPIDIRPTVHKALDFSSGPVSAKATVSLNAKAFTENYCQDARAVNLTAYAFITPTHLPSTPGCNGIPSTGLYAYNVRVEPYRDVAVVNSMTGTTTLKKWCFVRVRVFDFLTLKGSDNVGLGGTVAAADSSTPNTPGANTPNPSPPATITVGAGGAATVAPGADSDVTDSGPSNPVAYADPSGGGGGVVTSVPGSGGTGGSTTVIAPFINTQPASLSVPVNAPAVFTVSASGTDLQYQWSKGGVAIPGATLPSLTFNSAQTTDGGYYAVTVSNSSANLDGTTTLHSVSSAGATLTVEAINSADPKVLYVPPSRRVLAGSPAAQFIVKAYSGSNATVEWYTVIGGSHTTLRSTTITPDSLGIVTDTFGVVPTTGMLNTTTTYYCKITNTASNITVSALLIVAATATPSVAFSYPKPSLSVPTFSPNSTYTPLQLQFNAPWPEDTVFSVTTNGHGQITHGIGGPVVTQLTIPAYKLTSDGAVTTQPQYFYHAVDLDYVGDSNPYSARGGKVTVKATGLLTIGGAAAGVSASALTATTTFLVQTDTYH